MITYIKRNTILITIMAMIAMLLAFGIYTYNANAQSFAITSQLELGDSGTQVTALQQFLAQDSLVYPRALITGYYGPLTENAVRQFQIAYNISPVGRVGPLTLSAIRSVLNTSARLDVQGPVIANISSTPSNSSANLHWTMNEPANVKVFYSTTPIVMRESELSHVEPYISGVMINVPFSQSQGATISSLLGNTTYYYVVEAIDQLGNVSISPQGTFKTN